MFALLLIVAIHQAKPAFDFDVSNGLHVKVLGIPVVEGSWLQYYEAGWTKGYYSTANAEPKVQRVDADTVKVDYSGYNGIAVLTGQGHISSRRLRSSQGSL